MGEGKETFCRAGKYVCPRTPEQVFDQGHAFLRPVEEVDLDFGTACLLECSNLTGSKRSGIPVHGNDRLPGSKQ